MGLRSLWFATLEWLAIKLHLRRYGGAAPATIPARLVFVCTGNICRSPYAEAVARSMGLAAVSAGINTTPGLPAHAQAVTVASARGIDLSNHRTTAWDDVQLGAGDLVVALELRHALAVASRARVAGCQVTLMNAFSRNGFATLTDPYGNSSEAFESVFDRIEHLLLDLRNFLLERSPRPKSVVAWTLWFAASCVKDVAGRVCVLAGVHKRLLHGRAAIVTFHSVIPGASDGPLRCGVRDLDRYCRFLSTHMTVCTLGEMVDRVRRQQTLTGEVAITFDDGYADNAELAAPILRKHGLRATFFLSTAFVDSRTQSPWDSKAGVRSRWMTQDQVKSLSLEGHEIGAHTRTHCDLSSVDENVALSEIAGSRDDIRLWIGEAPKHFAVPYGRTFPSLPRIAAICRDLGFESVMTCSGGFVDGSRADLVWQRIALTPISYLSPYAWLFDVLRDLRSPVARR